MVSKHRFIHYIIGIVEIDAQHLDLMSTLELLSFYIKTGADHSSVEALTNIFFKSLQNHYDTEERIMKELNIPHGTQDHHIQEHRKLLDATTKIVDRILADPNLDLSKAKEFEEELIKHIDHYDIPTFKPYAKHLPN